MKRRHVLGVLAVCVACCASAARAGNDVYCVTYNHHIEKGETELMVMTDFTAPAHREEGFGDYLSSMLELELGVTDQWATELMLEGFYDVSEDHGKFTGFRWENRYRVHPEKNRGLNPVLYMEYEDLDPETRFKMEVSGRTDGKGEPAVAESARERILETRLVLSRDVGAYNVAVNWINETDMQKNGFTEFGYAFGIRRALGGGCHDGPLACGGPGAAAQPPGPTSRYACAMHTEETSPDPDRCPDCGVKMSPVPGGGPGSGGGRTGWSWRPAAIGLELYGGLGNVHAFGGRWSVLEQYIAPIVAFHPRPGSMVHLSAAIGLSAASDDLIRTAVAFEF